MMIILAVVTVSWKQRERAFSVDKGHLPYLMLNAAERSRRMRTEKRQGF